MTCIEVGNLLRKLPTLSSPSPRRVIGPWLAALALIGLFGAGASSASGAMIKYEFGGVITSADLSTGVAPGTRFSGTFGFDPDFNPGTATIEGSVTYIFNPLVFGRSDPDTSYLTANVGGTPVLDGRGLDLGVRDTTISPGPPSPPFTSVGLSSENAQVRVELGLTNPSRSVDPTLELPTSFSLGDYPVTKFLVTSLSSGHAETIYEGTIDTLTAVPIPEPGMLALPGLIGVGLALRGLLRRRQP
jgi:hypothetical protein